MHDILTNIVGYTAAVLGTLIILPQVIKSLRTKKTNDVSMGMIIIFIINNCLWTTYGLLLWAGPLIISNTISLALVITQMVLKFKYDS